MQTLGKVLLRAGEPEQAEELLRGSLEMRRKILGPDHPDLAHAERSLGGLLAVRGTFDEAEELLALSEERYRRIVGAEHSWFASNLTEQGRLAFRSGRLREAEELLGRAIEIQRDLRSRPDAALSARTELAEVLVASGRFAEARDVAAPALEAARARFRGDDARVAALESVLGGALLGAGSPEAARPLLERAREALEDHGGDPRRRRLALERWEALQLVSRAAARSQGARAGLPTSGAGLDGGPGPS